MNGIHNVIRYIPAVWHDVDFDSHNIYGLLYYKMKFQEEYFNSSRTHCKNAPKTTTRIKIVKNLAYRLWKNTYILNALTEHDLKYGEIKMKSIPEYNENGKIKWYRYHFDTTPEENKNYARWSNHADYLQQQDKQMLFEMLKKYIESFWD
jgi:hypothetical protein